MKRQLERSRARRQALQILFQSDIRSCSATSLLEEGGTVITSPDGDATLGSAAVDDFARSLVEGVEAHRADLDERIVEISENWTLSRMPAVDRNILRIALYELSFEPDIPEGVSINEAVEMAKLFGGDESSKFVNGVLGKAVRADARSAATADDASGAPAGDDRALTEVVERVDGQDGV
ncbi:MAG: transcription antitermination factor NusB [Coriobacteriales bacterium]